MSKNIYGDSRDPREISKEFANYFIEKWGGEGVATSPTGEPLYYGKSMHVCDFHHFCLWGGEKEDHLFVIPESEYDENDGQQYLNLHDAEEYECADRWYKEWNEELRAEEEYDFYQALVPGVLAQAA